MIAGRMSEAKHPRVVRGSMAAVYEEADKVAAASSAKKDPYLWAEATSAELKRVCSERMQIPQSSNKFELRKRKAIIHGPKIEHVIWNSKLMVPRCASYVVDTNLTCENLKCIYDYMYIWIQVYMYACVFVSM